MTTAEKFTVHEALLEDRRNDPSRAGEGDIVELKDGRLLILYSRFEAGSDHSHAPIVKRTSADGGKTWSDFEVVFDVPEGSLNVMSVSLLRLADGRIGCVYMHKHALEDCHGVWTASEDEGKTWSAPVRLTERLGYYVVNNDRLLQLSSGRILVPYAYSPTAKETDRALAGCVISDDGGRSWRLGREEHAIGPDSHVRPKLLDAEYERSMPPLEEQHFVTQEAGVVELADGRVMMWVRSNAGYAFRCFSPDGGDTWTPFEAIEEFAMPCGPAAIKRLPGAGRLVMLYNDREGVPYGPRYPFQWRTPLSCAVSDDEGRTWRRLPRDVESDDSVNYCYASLSFFDGSSKAVMSYYVGWPSELDEQGKPKLENRRNLASLKIKVLERAFFEG